MWYFMRLALFVRATFRILVGVRIMMILPMEAVM
jgi:hypothetical protein